MYSVHNGPWRSDQRCDMRCTCIAVAQTAAARCTLYCAVLYYTVLWCAVVCCAVLYCAVLYNHTRPCGGRKLTVYNKNLVF
jgi:hypothetical protein